MSINVTVNKSIETVVVPVEKATVVEVSPTEQVNLNVTAPQPVSIIEVVGGSTADLSSYVKKAETGIFLTSGLAENLYYPLSNPSGFGTGLNPTGYLLASQTGQFYPSSNPSGYITGLVVRPSETGDFITVYQTGNFSPLVHIHNQYVQTGNTGLFITANQTGVFYPASNPSGFVTGNVVRPSETGNFILNSQTGQFAPSVHTHIQYVQTGETGQFYPASNPSGFITGLDTGHNHDTQYYPLNTNPSGYVTGNIVRPTETGVFITNSQTGQFASSGHSHPIYVQTGETGQFAQTGWVNDYYYPRSNPSGFGAGGGGVSETWVDNNYYPRSNPSGFSVKTYAGGTINRTSGLISSISFTDGRIINLNKTSGILTSVTDGTHTWTFLRNNSNQITGWEVV